MEDKAKKFVTFETSVAMWQAIKVEAYRRGKTVKQFLNEIISKVLKENKGGK